MLSYWIIRENSTIIKENGRTGREIFDPFEGWKPEYITDESVDFPVTDPPVVAKKGGD